MIHGYQITEKLHQTGQAVVYRAIRGADHCRVVLKMLNSQYPTPRELARYRQEYELIRSLSIPGVIQAYGHEKPGNSIAIVLEDFGGSSLNLSFERERPTVEQLLDLAIQTTAALGQLHQQGIIHKDVNPSNMVWNPRSGQLKLIDFGIATRLSSESPGLMDPGVLEGSLPYVSPEQTGRMNRRLDYRTDFYSLGVTLYELWTGQRPFDRQDALELVHCHLAAQPRPPAQLREDTPPILSQIIMKLMAKTAEDRYQSASGLMADLERCLEQVRSGQTLESFPLGRDDVSERFEIPQKLYGRSAETGVLLDAFERVGHGRSEWVLVAGYSGIGKSSLVRELYRPITRKNAFFVSGKFDLLQRATPYSALAAACSELVKQLLTRSQDELLRWREELLAAAGPNGSLLVELIPALELVIGPQPVVDELGPTEAHNRMLLAFSSFLRVFCRPAHPLVMFLDDLQCIDAATLRLLEPMMSNQDISHLLLIGAYRDNEVDAAHPLATALRGLADQGVPIHTIHLHPLSLADMMQMLADTLHLSPEAVRSLAELVLRRTGGNPFFVNALLKTLHEDGLLRFDASVPGWRWDMAGIEAMPVMDNVAELLTPRLRRFPEETQALLRLAACLGNHFDVDTLALIAERSPAECAGALMAAVREDYILPAAEPVAMAAETQEPQLLVREYRFAHDRVQQAAYALIPAEQRAAIHLEIGRLLLARLSSEERDARLFELVDHLNLGRLVQNTVAERHPVSPVELATLNLAAGRRARQAAAHGAAARYLAIGLELSGDAWEQHYDLALGLHTEGALAEYCQGDYARSQALVDTALREAKSAVVKARMYLMLLVQYSNQGRYDEAFGAARAALALLGQPLPQAPELEAAVVQELGRGRQLLGDRSIESLIDAPDMVDDACKVAIEVLGALAIPAYMAADMEMHSFSAARMVNLTLEHGQCTAGVVGYSTYALMLAARFEEYQRAYQFAALAMRLADRFHSPVAKCRAAVGMFGINLPWVRPLWEAYPISIESFEVALQQGELQYASFNLMQRQMLYFHHGMSLERILDESSAAVRFGKRNKNTVVVNTLDAIRIATAHLSDDGGHDDVPPMGDDAAYVARCRQEGTFLSLGFYQVVKCLALYLDQEYERALEAASEAEKLFAYLEVMIARVIGRFYHSLCLTALFPQRSPEQQAECWRLLESHQAQMKLCMDNCPENFRHMYLLVAAEMARITGDHLGAMERYVQAIESAEDNGFRQHVALASELAAQFFLAREQTRYAMLHLRDAHYSYGLWGAKRKVAMLEAQHGARLVHARQDGPRPGETRKSKQATTSTTSASAQLDLASVIKASQTLSSEISLDRLLGRLIEIVIESAGAQHGYLILRRRDRLVIEARGTLGEDVEVLKALPLDGDDGRRSLVSTAVVQYVLRSRETVVLHDAVREGPFVTDPHVLATRSRSVLCMPLLDQGSVSGVVYLENNLSPQAFTPERVELLALLSAQMAISLDNSFLYRNLQRASQDLERVLYSIAHDLKEPLRTVQSFSELLERRHGAQVDDQGRQYLARIIQAGQHLGNLLEAIRTVSAIRRIDGPHRPVPGEDLVQDALRRLQPVIEKTRAVVRVSGELPQLAVERRWASEALYQLVHNALQYTRDGLAPEIDIEPYDGSEGTGFVVKDRGSGIPEEYAERVFELFRRAVGRERPGTGAGLAIVRQIAAKHGGNAWLRPRVGGGTAVYITFA
jgi:predicted ATPase/signal transduction histidine kinase/tRNA A-37 threonylcarbamoyl transferase component Bud32